jgi:hypothetical protein
LATTSSWASNNLGGILRVNPDDFGKYSIDVKMGYVAGDLLGIEPGNAEMGAGVGGEVVGVGADATGVGAVAGIPLNIISAGSYCAWSYCCCYLWK